MSPETPADEPPETRRERELTELLWDRHKVVKALIRALAKERRDRAKLIETLGEAKAHITELRKEVRRLRSEKPEGPA